MATQEELRAQFEGGSAEPSQEELRAQFESRSTSVPEPEPMRTRTLRDAIREKTPTLDPSSVDRDVASLQAGFMDPVYGVSKLVTKGVEKLTGRESGNFSDEMMQQREDAIPGEGFNPARMAGTMANPMTWVGPGKTKIAGRVLTGTMEALGKHSFTNALQATMMPVEPGENYWRKKAEQAAFGAAVGTVLSGTGAGLSNAQKFIKSRFSDSPGQATRYLKELFGDDAAEVARQLDNLSSNVPGEKPTVGWLSTLDDGRWPQGAAIEKEARGSKEFAGRFNQRDAENTKAQLALMDKMRQGGVRPLNAAGRETPSVFERDAANSARPFYDTASQEMMYVPTKLKQAIQGAEAVKAARKGENFVSQAELNADAGLSSRRPVPGPIRGGESGFPTPENLDIWNPDRWQNNLPMESIGSLQTQRQSMDSLIRASKNTTDPNAIESARLLREVRNGLTDRMRKASPNFDVAEEIFKERMAPQNRADYVTVLRNKFNSPAGPNRIGFLNALRDPERTAAAAKIPFEVDSTEQLMGQGNAGLRRMAQINALKDAAERDLKLGMIYAPEKVKGEFLDVGEEIDRATPSLLLKSITTAKRLSKLASEKMTTKMKRVVNEAALEPSEIARLLRAVNPEDRSQLWTTLRAMDEYGVRPITGGVRSEISRELGGLE